MTKQQALYKFFNGFGIVAYPISSVPNDTTFPWIEYDANIGYTGDGECSCIVDVWYHTESEAVPDAKADEIARAIGEGGIQIPYDDGYARGTIWIKRGEPWCISIRDDKDDTIKRRELNISLEFL